MQFKKKSVYQDKGGKTRIDVTVERPLYERIKDIAVLHNTTAKEVTNRLLEKALAIYEQEEVSKT